MGQPADPRRGLGGVGFTIPRRRPGRPAEGMVTMSEQSQRLSDLASHISRTVIENKDDLIRLLVGWDGAFTAESLKQHREQMVENRAGMLIDDPAMFESSGPLTRGISIERRGHALVELDWFSEATSRALTLENLRRLRKGKPRRRGDSFSVIDVMDRFPEHRKAIARRLADEAIPSASHFSDPIEGPLHRFTEAFTGEHPGITSRLNALSVSHSVAGRIFAPNPDAVPIGLDLFPKAEDARYVAGLGLVLLWIATDQDADSKHIDIFQAIAPAFSGWRWLGRSSRPLWYDGNTPRHPQPDRSEALKLVTRRLEGNAGESFSRWIEAAAGVWPQPEWSQPMPLKVLANRINLDVKSPNRRAIEPHIKAMGSKIKEVNRSSVQVDLAPLPAATRTRIEAPQ